MTPSPAARARRFGRHAAKSATPHAKRGEEELQSTRAPDALMIGASRASSASRKASVSAGERQIAVAARSKNFALRSSLSSAFFDNSDRRGIASGGSLAGPVSVVHELMSKPGSVSAIAGTSGTTGVLSFEVTPSARTLLTRYCAKAP